MPAEFLVQKTLAIQYTGSNSSEVLGLCPDILGSDNEMHSATIDSEEDGVLVIAYSDAGAGPAEFTLNTGDWLRIPAAVEAPSGQPNVLVSDDAFDSYYVKLSDIE